MRADVVEQIAEILVSVRQDHPLRVAVDGITASGKSTWTREIAEAVAAQGKTTIHLSMDGFHQLRAHRYRQGRGSATGYYEDAYDFEALVRHVLSPLGPGGDRRYRTRTMDLAADTPVDEPPSEAPADAVLLVDGTFLQRDIRRSWDRVLFVDTSFPVARDRGIRRDAAALGGAEAAGIAFDTRYHAACRLYVDQVEPAATADIVISNDDLHRPWLTVSE